VTQVNINVRRPEQRAAGNPWPEWPRTYELTYALAEGGDEAFGLEAAEFIAGSDGRVAALRLQRVAWDYDENGRRTQRYVVDGDVRLEAELVLIAIGFAGADLGGLAAEGIATTPRGTIQIDEQMMTALPGVFAAGDASRGQSLVVWAIGEGRDAARQIDLHLMGHSRLPASLRTANPPLGF
jgi:NADPH-dependent glutamate synthase beta subunit-like oxidoreductase